jgi:hypothetical protein
MALFGKRPSPYYGKNSWNKQRQMTVINFFMTWRSVNTENVKNFETIQVQSQKPSSAVMKLALMRTATDMDHPELPLLQIICLLELPDSETVAQINALQSPSNRHISTSTVYRRMCESACKHAVHWLPLFCSSAFNTIVPSMLIIKFEDLGLKPALCNWVLDILTGHPRWGW